uniref:CSC1/OSCA1-like 7TM region domain-containing protein n=1 Tax=Alexandrium catenella TaxID=2925 RepID=A0A7S1MH41_ALECA|mmetsp:Transcript_26778/g.72659  ORF Transcript_26778/g.72659 Transcript_26778/m.72659 type:complete len:414 (+) Transcript_26778:2-1243(+)
MKLLSPDDEEELEVTRAPDVQDVLWEDLVKDPSANSAREIVGMLLIIGLFFLFLPMVAGLAAITNLQNLADLLPFVGRFIVKFPGIVNLWNGFVGAMALSIVMGLVPMFLALISSHFFILRAKSIVQHYIQDYYFKFSVVFVLLVTAIGSSLISTSQKLIRDPMAVFSLLASTMPTSTHFYMNYFAIQWSTHFINITRYNNLLKFGVYSRIYESLEAKSYSEPEDQVSYGIGARSAQWSLLLTTGVVFGTLAPIMCLFAAINFAISRLVYGYLVVFAETRKTDLGGLFFVTQLKHVQQGEFVYVALMTGVLLQRSKTVVPGIVAACAFLPLFYTYNKFKKYRWEYMEFSEVKDYDQKLRDGEIPEVAFKGSPDAGPGAYEQPELLLVAPPKKEEPPGYTTILGLDCSKFVVNC